MSPLWRDEIGIYLSPFRVCLVRRKRGLRPRLVCSEGHLVQPPESPGWKPALEILSRRLMALGGSRARARVVVADHWVRYAVLPWSDSLSSEYERMGHARALLESSFGDEVADWKVILTDAPPGESRLTCALRNDMLDALRAVVSSHGLELSSVQPQLVAAYNGWRTRLPLDRVAWFVTVEQGALAALRIHAHGIDRVHSMRTGADWSRDLKRLQTIIRLGSENPTETGVYIDAPGSLRREMPEGIPRLRWLDDAQLAPMTLHRILPVPARTA